MIPMQNKKEYLRAYYLANCEKLKKRASNYYAANKEAVLAYACDYREKNPDAMRVWRAANKERIKASKRAWRAANREKVRAKRNEKNKRQYYSDLVFRLIVRMRKHIARAVSLGLSGGKTKRTFEYIGCTPAALVAHLEKQFQPGMTWKNRRKWHVDHIRPLSSFGPDELQFANHFTNLKPLWAADNLAKNAKWEASA
jgi:hypothetical protein